MPRPEDAARRQAIAEDPLLAPTLRARTAEVDAKLHALRLQMIFLFTFLVAGLVVMSIFFRSQDNQIKLDRYLSCQQRTEDIKRYNASLPEAFPGYPLPTCPPDPRL
jgi:hypothetical protein